MVKATFRSDTNSGVITLKVTGHAGAAEKGKDIICASASILAYTVAQIAKYMHSLGQLKKKPTIKLESGNATIVVKPRDKFYGEAMQSFFVAQVGYSLLAHNYPDYVGLTMFGEAEQA